MKNKLVVFTLFIIHVQTFMVAHARQWLRNTLDWSNTVYIECKFLALARQIPCCAWLEVFF